MTVSHAIRNAERMLPGSPSHDGESDPRWQAIIGVGDFVEHYPNEIWLFTRKWGAHANVDLRVAVATCLLEHLLEHHFEQIFPQVSDSCRKSKRFADTFSRCGEFGQTCRRGNLARFRTLQRKVSNSLANKALQ